jgi:hypothetical protein
VAVLTDLAVGRRPDVGPIAVAARALELHVVDVGAVAEVSKIDREGSLAKIRVTFGAWRGALPVMA